MRLTALRVYAQTKCPKGRKFSKSEDSFPPSQQFVAELAETLEILEEFQLLRVPTEPQPDRFLLFREGTASASFFDTHSNCSRSDSHKFSLRSEIGHERVPRGRLNQRTVKQNYLALPMVPTLSTVAKGAGRDAPSSSYDLSRPTSSPPADGQQE